MGIHACAFICILLNSKSKKKKKKRKKKKKKNQRVNKGACGP